MILLYIPCSIVYCIHKSSDTSLTISHSASDRIHNRRNLSNPTPYNSFLLPFSQLLKWVVRAFFLSRSSILLVIGYPGEFQLQYLLQQKFQPPCVLLLLLLWLCIRFFHNKLFIKTIIKLLWNIIYVYKGMFFQQWLVWIFFKSSPWVWGAESSYLMRVSSLLLIKR